MSEETKAPTTKPESWWKRWFKGLSLFAIVGGLASFAVNFGTEWYSERKSEEYERMTKIEEQLEDLNKNLAVMNQARVDERSDREAAWKILQHNTQDMNDLKVQTRINALMNERNYRDMKAAHDRNNNSGHRCQMHDEPEGKKPSADIKELTELQKIWKRSMGSDEEKKALAEEDAEKEEDAKIKELLKEAKKKSENKTLNQFKEQHKLPPTRQYEQRQKK